jgi:hypothetical protein
MSLSDLAALGSFISGLAVLVSLVFLYFQLRQVHTQVAQTERNQQAAIAQARTESQVSVLVAMADPCVAEAFSKAMQGADDLTGTELAQFTSLHRAMMVNGENAFLQNRAGLITDAAFEGALLSMKYLAAAPAFRAYWPVVRTACGLQFAEFMDKTISGCPVALPVDALSAFKASFAAEIRNASA